MFGKIITKKLVLMSNFSLEWFRHTRSRQTFDMWFHNLGPPSIETTRSLTGRGWRPVKSQIIESPLD